MGKVTIRLIKPKWVFLQLIKVQEHGIVVMTFKQLMQCVQL